MTWVGMHHNGLVAGQWSLGTDFTTTHLDTLFGQEKKIFSILFCCSALSENFCDRVAPTWALARCAGVACGLP